MHALGPSWRIYLAVVSIIVEVSAIKLLCKTLSNAKYDIPLEIRLMKFTTDLEHDKKE